MAVLFSVLWLLVIILLPSLGVWVASSLAVYSGGPVWLAVVAGGLLFPALPLSWEAWAESRRRKRKAPGKRFLAAWDRIALRTLFINLVFLSSVLAYAPRSAFAALSARGDWFLEGRAGTAVETSRSLLFRTAEGLEWLYNAARNDPYEKELRKEDQPLQEPRPVASSPKQPASEAPPPWNGQGVPPWPLPASLHPLVSRLPAEVETSLESVARYLSEREPNQWLRIKALHDYVADRIAYDVPAYLRGEIPPQDAATVFERRTAVCAGYANLLAALGAAAREEITVVSGDARNEGNDLTGEAHAWNAARIEGGWVLLDPTWNAGWVNKDSFNKEYKTHYLFPPPEIMGVSHFPRESAWQLREPPLTRGAFFRQPMLRASFFANGFRLVTPDRSQVTVDRVFLASIQNPSGRFLLAKARPQHSGEELECAVAGTSSLSLSCTFAVPGAYRIRIYAGTLQYGTYSLAGEFLAQVRGGG